MEKYDIKLQLPWVLIILMGMTLYGRDRISDIINLSHSLDEDHEHSQRCARIKHSWASFLNL